MFQGATRSSIVAFGLVRGPRPAARASWARDPAGRHRQRHRRRRLPPPRRHRRPLSACSRCRSPPASAWPFAARRPRWPSPPRSAPRWPTPGGPAIRLWTAWLSPAPARLPRHVPLRSRRSAAWSRATTSTRPSSGAFGSGTPPPVVMIVFDEWPLASIVRQDGTIDADLYPNVAALAARLDLVPGHHDGGQPDQLRRARPAHRRRARVEGDTADASTHPENLFTLLGGTYDLDVTERITRLCPTSLCATGGGRRDRRTPIDLADLLAEAADVYADRLTPGEPRGPGHRRVRRARRRGRRGPGRRRPDGPRRPPRPSTRDPRPLPPRASAATRTPTLHFLHLLAPHTPYRHLPDGHQYEADPALRQITAEDDAEAAATCAARPSPPPCSTASASSWRWPTSTACWATCSTGSASTGLYDDALRRRHLRPRHRVPARRGRPGPRGGRRSTPDGPARAALGPPVREGARARPTGVVSDVPAETIDVLPTIADRLGIDLPWEVDGDRPGRAEPDRPGADLRPRPGLVVRHLRPGPAGGRSTPTSPTSSPSASTPSCRGRVRTGGGGSALDPTCSGARPRARCCRRRSTTSGGSSTSTSRDRGPRGRLRTGRARRRACGDRRQRRRSPRWSTPTRTPTARAASPRSSSPTSWSTAPTASRRTARSPPPPSAARVDRQRQLLTTSLAQR